MMAEHDELNNIVLVGFMAVGKSTLGQLLAQKLKWTFLDTDQEIEKQTGRTIPDIFQEHGEMRFRLEEELLISRLKGVSHTVIATGGGTIMSPENFQTLKSLGMMIHLHAPLQVVLQRVKKQQDRPMLNRSQDELEKLWDKRLPIYKQADMTLETTGREIEEIVEDILRHVKGDYQNDATKN